MLDSRANKWRAALELSDAGRRLAAPNCPTAHRELRVTVVITVSDLASPIGGAEPAHQARPGLGQKA